MTTEHRIVCGPSEDQAPGGRLSLEVNGTAINANLRVSHLREHFLKEMPDVLADLLEVAAYVYAADSAISRGGAVAAQMGLYWRRSLNFDVPVRCREIWEEPGTSRLLAETLGYLSEDDYTFDFREHAGHRIEASIPFLDFGEDDAWRPDEVIMFSGGLDSLAGALDAVVGRQKRVALVSHSSAATMTRVQRELAEELAGLGRKTASDVVRHFPIRAHMQDGALYEGSHRSRSFLFATLGIVIARSFGLGQADFCENGIVSLNLPLLAQHVGARATRSTHPKALKGLSGLFSKLLGAEVRISNPLFWHTKTDVLKRIYDLGCGHLIKRSRSCANVRRTSKMHPHCGRCSQCIDRRFAALASGLDTADPGEGYEVDLLTGARKGQDRELALGYVRNARRVRGLTTSELVQAFPEVSRALQSLDLEPALAHGQIADLLRRHGKAVTSVMENALEHTERPEGSLLALYAAPDEVLHSERVEQPVPAPFHLMIEIDEKRARARLNGVLDVQNTPFATLATFAEAHLRSLGLGRVPEEFELLKARDLRKSWNLTEDSGVRRRITRLRRLLVESFGEDAEEVLENLSWHGYRLRPEAVTIAKVALPEAPGF